MLADAKAWFETHTPNQANADKAMLLGWASTLDQYNNGAGEIGPGHCSEDSLSKQGFLDDEPVSTPNEAPASNPVKDEDGQKAQEEPEEGQLEEGQEEGQPEEEARSEEGQPRKEGSYRKQGDSKKGAQKQGRRPTNLRPGLSTLRW